MIQFSSETRESLCVLFGVNMLRLQEIINDTSGELQRKAFAAYKTIMWLDARNKRREAIRRRLFIRWLRRIYRSNQSEMRAYGLEPGLPGVF